MRSLAQPSYDLAYCCLLIFFYFNFYVEPWNRGTFFKWPLSRKGQEAAKGCPLNRGSVPGEVTSSSSHVFNVKIEKFVGDNSRQSFTFLVSGMLGG